MKMADKLDLEVGQIAKTMGRQIAVPDWYETANYELKRMERLVNLPIIRLTNSGKHINTNSYRQSGLVCLVPERYLGMAILSVSIVAIREKSVIAQPTEWIEVYPLLDVDSIGREAEVVFTDYCLQAIEGYRAIWHNKEINKAP